MSNFEYKVIPAPVSGKRGKGIKGADGRFANALSEMINELAAQGWEYLRSESLPSVERSGIMRKRSESFQNVLVFRRATDAQSTPQDTEDTKDAAFNPFKKFSTREEPVLSRAAAATVIADTDETVELTELADDANDDDADDIGDKIDEFADSEMSKLRKHPSKPAD